MEQCSLLHHDPYKFHNFRLTPAKKHAARIYCAMLRGSPSDGRLRQIFDHIPRVAPSTDFDLLIKALPETRAIINDAYGSFIDEFKSSKYINAKEIPTVAGLSSPVRISPLLATLQWLVAQHDVMRARNRDFCDLRPGDREYELGAVIEDAFRAYIDVYRVHIPLYDKVYEEFDAFGDIQEVFVGRDGIHARDGRRAQDIARRRKMGVHARLELIRRGVRPGMHIKYIVYPTDFKYDLSIGMKKTFLKLNDIGPEHNPYFFDTGYVGSVPEDILRTLGYGEDAVDPRIRLIYAEDGKRQVTDIDEATKRLSTENVLDFIEQTCKPEECAKGLYFDVATGKITHVAAPGSPDVWLIYQMVRQALVRHYIWQEFLEP